MTTTRKRKPENTVIDSRAGTMRCLVCGDAIPIPLGVSTWCVAVMKAFITAHRGCRPGSAGQRTYFQPSCKSCPSCQTFGPDEKPEPGNG